MEKITHGKYVEITYDLYKIAEDGAETLMHQVDPDQPEVIVYGATEGLLEPLEQQLLGLAEGGHFDVVATPEQAFGPRSDEYIVNLEKEVFNVDGKFDSKMVHVGAALPMMTADGFQVYGTVVNISDKEVTMDFNHPLAGSKVRLRGEVKTVRDATEQEIKAAKGGCGCGCHDHECGDDCGCHDHDCGCGDHDCGCGCH